MKVKNIFLKVFQEYLLKETECKKIYGKSYPNTKYSLTTILESIFFILKTGIPWRDLVYISHINWNTIYFHFVRLCKLNIFNKFFTYLRDLYIKQNLSCVQIIDSTFIQNKFGKQHIGRNTFFKSKNCNKISLITDIYGIPLSIYVGLGNLHDITLAEHHITDLCFIQRKYHKNILLGDKGYISKNFSSTLSTHNYTLMVPKKINMKNTEYPYDPQLYKKRIFIEHSFANVKCYRRIQLRYDSSISHFNSFVYLAFSMLILTKFY